MAQVPLEQYFDRLRKSDSKYHWPLEREKERRVEREGIHKEFPYVITYCGNYGPDFILDDMQDWCRDQFGNSGGECHWHECPQGWPYWYEKAGLEEILEKELDDNTKNNPEPSKKDKQAHAAWEESGSIIINEHFDMIDKRPDAPEKHSHVGIWAHYFVCKTGYDYGYEDYCFKNTEDALYFKIMWDEEAEKRG